MPWLSLLNTYKIMIASSNITYLASSNASNILNCSNPIALSVDNNNLNVLSTNTAWSPISSKPVYVPIQTNAIVNSSNVFSINLDAASNIYVSGIYSKTPIINALASCNILNPTSNTAAYLIKYNVSGSAISMASIDNIINTSMAIDANSNVILACSYSNLPNIYNSNAVLSLNITTIPTTTDASALIIKYDSNTQASWATCVNHMNATYVSTDTCNNIILAGTSLPNTQSIICDASNVIATNPYSLSAYASVTTIAGSGTATYFDGTGTNASFNWPGSLVTDSNGNIYVSDTNNHRIRKINNIGLVTTLAGSGIATYLDATGILAGFNNPNGIYLDSSNNIYVADTTNNRIRKITQTGIVTTLAGSGSAAFADGLGTAASFNNPLALVIDSSNNIYVADRYNSLIRKITSNGQVTTIGSVTEPFGVTIDSLGNIYASKYWSHLIIKMTQAGVVTTLAGSGSGAYADGIGVSASFQYPRGLACDPFNNIYVADVWNNRIRKITLAGVVTTIAGTGANTYIDGTGTFAGIRAQGVSTDALGNVYVADTENSRIRRIEILGVQVNTLAGSGTATFLDGIGAYAGIKGPRNITCDISGNIYLADTDNHRIRKITPSGIVTTFAGSGVATYLDAIGTLAGFNQPADVVIDFNNNIYVADNVNNRIRKISATGVVTTFAGSGTATYLDAIGTLAGFNTPCSIAIDSSNNLYVGDMFNYRIRKISTTGQVTTLAGNGTATFFDGTGTLAGFRNVLFGITVDQNFNVYVADRDNYRIRKITPLGLVTTIAGNGTITSVDGIGTLAGLNQPTQLFIDISGNLFWCDEASGKIRKMDPNGIISTIVSSFNVPFGIALDKTRGIIYVSDYGTNKITALSVPFIATTIAGSGTATYLDGTGTLAGFSNPTGIAIDISGNIYISDVNNNRIRKITSTGQVTTLAGSGIATYLDATGTLAGFNSPYDLSVDTIGNVYVNDQNNNRIRKISPSGVVTTFAGSGTATFLDGIGTNASFTRPNGITIDINGNIYVSSNNRIRKISPAGVVTTLAGSGTATFLDGTGTIAGFINPNGIVVDTSGFVYVADQDNNRIRKISSSGVVTTLAGSGISTYLDGTGTAAGLRNPYGVTIDILGNVYVTELTSQRIRKITSAGIVTTLAGSGTATYLEGIGTNSGFNNPNRIIIDVQGNIYITDSSNNRIRKLIPGSFNTIVNNITASSNISLPTSINSAAIAVKYDSTGKSKWSLMVSSSDECKAVATDLNNNVFLVGQYNSGTAELPSGTAELPSGTASVYQNTTLVTGLNNLSTESNASFALKVDINGTPQWLIKIDNAIRAMSAVTDFWGNLYMAGSYLTAAKLYNYDGTNTISLPAPSNISTYLAKYSPSGTAQWVASILQTDTIGSNQGNCLAIDSLNNIYLAGSYSQTPIINTSPLTLLTSSNITSGYVVKYDSNGTPQAAFSLTSSNSNANINSITVDASGSNIYVAGYYTSQVTLYDGNNLSLNNLPIGGANYGQTALFVQYKLQTSAIYLQCSSNNLDGQQKSITNVGSNLTTVNVLSSNQIISTVNFRPGSTLVYTYYNNNWYYMGSDAILGPLTISNTISTITLSWLKSINLNYCIITLPNSNNTSQITNNTYTDSTLTEGAVYKYVLTPYNYGGIAGAPITINQSTYQRIWYPTAAAQNLSTPTYNYRNVNFSFTFTNALDYTNYAITTIQPQYMLDQNYQSYNTWFKYDGSSYAYSLSTPIINSYKGGVLNIIGDSAYILTGFKLIGSPTYGPTSFRPKQILIFGTNDNVTYTLLDNTTHINTSFTSSNNYWILQKMFTNSTSYKTYTMMISSALDQNMVIVSEFYWYM